MEGTPCPSVSVSCWLNLYACTRKESRTGALGLLPQSNMEADVGLRANNTVTQEGKQPCAPHCQLLFNLKKQRVSNITYNQRNANEGALNSLKCSQLAKRKKADEATVDEGLCKLTLPVCSELEYKLITFLELRWAECCGCCDCAPCCRDVTGGSLSSSQAFAVDVPYSRVASCQEPPHTGRPSTTPQSGQLFSIHLSCDAHT